MNIFYVDDDPTRAAVSLGDRHVVKMALETAQILCTVARRHGYDAPYRPTHAAHPCTLWAGSASRNWEWLHSHGMALCAEYTHRYGKVHKCQAVLDLLSLPHTMPSGWTPPAQCMPDIYKGNCPVTAYRSYYAAEKGSCHNWTRRSAPEWIAT